MDIFLQVLQNFQNTLSSAPSSSYIVNEQIRTHVKLDNLDLWKLLSVFKMIFFIAI